MSCKKISLIFALDTNRKNIHEEEQHIEQQFLQMAMEQQQFLYLYLYLYLYHAGLREVKQHISLLKMQANDYKQELVEEQQGATKTGAGIGGTAAPNRAIQT